VAINSSQEYSLGGCRGSESSRLEVSFGKMAEKEKKDFSLKEIFS